MSERNILHLKVKLVGVICWTNFVMVALFLNDLKPPMVCLYCNILALIRQHVHRIPTYIFNKLIFADSNNPFR